MKKPYLSIKNVSKSYDGKHALKNLSLDIYKHEIIGLIGHSGSGKSTLLQLIYGMQDKDSGIITLDGDKLFNRSEVLVPGDERIKYVRQNFDLFPDQTVYDNIEFQIRQYGREYVKERTAKLANAFGIEHVLDKKTKSISGGEQQRVAICCALADSPKLLLLDEPMAHLDQINARIIKSYLWKFVKSEKITTLFVTHSPEDALAYSTKIGIIGNGELIETGTPETVYNTPENRYTAELLGQCKHVPISIIPEEFLKPQRGKYFLRPEDISISETTEKSTLNASVFDTLYMGYRQLLTVKVKNKKLLLYTSSLKKFNNHESINITINFSKLIFVTK